MKMLFKKFKKYHEENPEVWDLIQKFSFEAIDKGHKNYSIAGIIERVRWETQVVINGEHKFKISNSYRAFYARLFMYSYQEYKGFFHLRGQEEFITRKKWEKFAKKQRRYIHNG